MAKTFNIEVDEHLKNKCDLFIKNIKSGMHYKADLDSNLNSVGMVRNIRRMLSLC